MKWNRAEAGRFSTTLGIALLLAGYIRYSYEGSLLLFSKILLITGGVLLVAGIVLGFRNIVGYFSKRSSQLGTNTTILALAVLAILGLLNFAGYRHHKRFDLTSEKRYTLSDQTRKIVSGLQKDVSVIRFAKKSDVDLDDLMSEYKDLSPHIKYLTVDPQARLEIAKEYGAGRMDEVFVAAGPRKEHIEPGLHGLFDEQELTSAILKVSSDHLKTICFTEGHGEKQVSDDTGNGYTLVDKELKKENYIVKPVNLVASNGVPPECDALVIAGPTQQFFPPETESVSKYLDGGGKVFLMVDPEKDPKFDELLKNWNIDLGKNLVIDASGIGSYFGAGPALPIVTDYGPSPITKDFGRTMTLFPVARTVTVADKSKAQPQTVELLKTSVRSFTIPGIKPGQEKVSFDPKTGSVGPLTLGVSADRKEGEKDARLVVIGNSGFAANQWLSQQRNGDLFFNTINWLVQDENLISIRPKTQLNRRVNLTAGQASALKWLDLVLLPGVVILSGVYIWWKRR
ncbi:MAG TPA: Gldg family protein [Candidatus Sulfotelmatobacter sp.]|nr:Gldg family protein [Candidatus Sulfotelmatobacter sp.]